MSKKLSLFFLLLILISSSCEKDENDQNADDYVGAWLSDENSKLYGSSKFEIHIKKVTESKINIENFYNLGFNKSISAQIDGNLVSILSQIYSGNTVEGTGVMNSATRITLNYTVYDGADIDTVSAILTKK